MTWPKIGHSQNINILICDVSKPVFTGPKHTGNGTLIGFVFVSIFNRSGPNQKKKLSVINF